MKTRILVIGLGNDLLADDAVGILAARELKERLEGKADVVETAEHGVVLLDHFIGYDKAIVVDAIKTGKNSPGTVLEIDPGKLMPAANPSPHFTGLPELFVLARQFEVEFPTEVRIVAMEVEDLYTLGGEMTPAVRDSLPELVRRVEEQVLRWSSGEWESIPPL